MLPAVLLSLVLASVVPLAEDWTRFRGPNGSGVSEGRGLPIEFGPAKNVVWKTELPEGYSSPVLSGHRVFVTAVRDGALLTIALDRATGKVLWERAAPRSRHEKLDKRNHAAAASPATDGGRVFVFFGDYGLLGYDVNGRELWRQPLGPFTNIYGMGASPIVVDDLVVLACDQSIGSFIAAFDRGRDASDGARRGRRRAAATRHRSSTRRREVRSRSCSPGHFC